MANDEDRGELRVIVAGGGTGGHLFPGIAVAEALARRRPSQIVFVGAERGIEARVVPARGYALRTLPVRALRGQGLGERLRSLARLAQSLVSAWRMLGELRPRLVIGVGGYASAPAVVAAWLRRVPTVLLEQNAHPGMTNRVLGRLAKRVCVAFPESVQHFPEGRVVETGNPVRSAKTAEPRSGDTFSLLLFGGSAGARRLNEVGVEAIGKLSRLGRLGAPIRIVHQTGTADEEKVVAAYRGLGLAADVRAFIEDMPSEYAAADLVICRAGASTVAELTAFGRPSILVPYPFAADDHQRKNAESLVRRGAALLILDRELTAEDLARAIDGLRKDPARLAAMGDAARSLGRPDAAERVVDVCLALLGGYGLPAGVPAHV